MTVHVIVPVFDCPEGLVKCMGSLYAQDHQDMTVTVIDDASTDERTLTMLAATRDFGWTLVRNPRNMRCPYNIVRGVHIADPEPHDVILLVDGDDWLPHDRVVSRIAEIHADPYVWLAYGSYRPEPFDEHCPPAQAYPLDVLHARSFRSAPTWFNHPLSFKAFLWNELPVAEMKDDDGRWFGTNYDETIMYGMLEMAANNTRFVDEVLYVYNAANPLSESRARRDESDGVGEQLRRRPALPLMELDGDRLRPVVMTAD